MNIITPLHSMLNTSLNMKLDKKKLLGQFFSGSKIAEMIEALVPSRNITSAIDPMCGIGDLLLPYADIEDLTGIEIDIQLRDTIIERLPNIQCISGNAFSAQTLSCLKSEGYDLVVANPPYVRKELIGKAEETKFSLTDITCNLHFFTDEFNTLNDSERKMMHCAIDKISGLSDLSIPAWLLCMMLVNHKGKFAIVLPNSWLSREYSQPILELIDNLFDVNYILNDVNGVWFKGNAQVRTSIIIASRKSTCSIDTSIVDLYESAQNSTSLYGNVTEAHNFANFIEKGFSIPNVCEIKRLSKSTITSVQTEKLEDCIRLVSSKSNKYTTMPSLEDVGLKISQGLRTGANGFFYLKRVSEGVYQSNISAGFISHKDNLFLPVIQGQSDLTDRYAVNTKLSTVLLNIQDSLTQSDFDNTEEEHKIGYIVLPLDIQQYISDSEKLKIKGNLIPSLSSVKTNVSKPKKGLYRFWYMIPKLQSRHTAKIFIPRVNSSAVTVYKCEIINAVIDANFSTIDNSDNSIWTNNALIAILNSTWCQVQYEQLGTVMGGGALKLEAVQLRKVKIPNLSKEVLLELDRIGGDLCKCKISNQSDLLDQVDLHIINSFLNSKEKSEILLGELKNQLQHYKETRQ